MNYKLCELHLNRAVLKILRKGRCQKLHFKKLHVFFFLLVYIDEISSSHDSSVIQ